MDKDQYIGETKGSRMKFELESLLNPTTDVWETRGKATFGVTYDLEHWGEQTEEAKAFDNDLMFSVAVVMKSLSEAVYSEDFQEELKRLANERPQE